MYLSSFGFSYSEKNWHKWQYIVWKASHYEVQVNHKSTVLVFPTNTCYKNKQVPSYQARYLFDSGGMPLLVNHGLCRPWSLLSGALVLIVPNH